MRTFLVFIALLSTLAPARAADPVALTAKPVAYAGEPPALTITGLNPAETVRVHTLQRWQRWQSDGAGGSGFKPTVIHAWGEFQADSTGKLDVDAAPPLAGTYTEPDPLGLFWSGYRRGDARLNTRLAPEAFAFEPEKEGVVYALCERAGTIVAQTQIRLATAPPGTQVVELHEPGLVGAFAAPKDAARLPTLIVLHGSEGGALPGCRAAAEVYAAKGFATIAIAWYAPDYMKVPGVPNIATNIDLALLERARSWLAARPEVDPARLGVVGVSKGAEMALVGATRFPWIRAVVAIVPSDVVWEGFAWEDKPGQRGSTWSWHDKPLPHVPLIPYHPSEQGRWKSNTQRYNTSRAQAAPDVVDAARIPIERSDANILLLAGERDEVWASAEMARALEARMVGAGKRARIELEIYPRAGHQIAGTGVFPVWLYADEGDNTDGLREGRDVRATGAAAAKAWVRALEFLRARL